jgi:hypothetical protein
LIPAPNQQVAKDFFGFTELIAISGVNEIPACVGVGVDDSANFVRPGTMSPASPKGTGTQYEFRYPQAGVFAKEFVTHIHSR